MNQQKMRVYKALLNTKAKVTWGKNVLLQLKIDGVKHSISRYPKQTGKLPQPSSKLPNPKFCFRFGFSMLKNILNCQGPFQAWVGIHVIDDHTQPRCEIQFLELTFLTKVQRITRQERNGIIIASSLLNLRRYSISKFCAGCKFNEAIVLKL